MKGGDRMIEEEARARTEGVVWEIVNRGRKKGKSSNGRINKEEWKEYFRV